MGEPAFLASFAPSSLFKHLAQFSLAFIFLCDAAKEVSAASPLCLKRLSFLNLVNPSV